jgi:transposase
MALTNEQEQALALLRQGMSTAAVAARLGLPRPTVWRWQNELPEFAATVTASPGREQRAPLAGRDVARIVVAVLVVLLSALFLYLGYWS